MSDDPQCTCDLVDVSDYSGPRYIRGWSRGCLVHPPSAYERQNAERDAAWQARDAAAKKAAREAP